MRLTDILTLERLVPPDQTEAIDSQDGAMEALSELLSEGVGVESLRVCRALEEREALQSTAIGDGVAIPHAAIDGLQHQRAAMLLCRKGIEFHAIDDRPVTIVVGVVGPGQATLKHLRMLSGIFRLLCDRSLRQDLLQSHSREQAYRLIRRYERLRA